MTLQPGRKQQSLRSEVPRFMFLKRRDFKAQYASHLEYPEWICVPKMGIERWCILSYPRPYKQLFWMWSLRSFFICACCLLAETSRRKKQNSMRWNGFSCKWFKDQSCLIRPEPEILEKMESLCTSEHRWSWLTTVGFQHVRYCRRQSKLLFDAQ